MDPSQHKKDVYEYSDFEILMRIATQHPATQNCLKVVCSTCLAHGIQVDGTTTSTTDEFQDFIDTNYIRFCEDAIRCMFVCGFVPWILRKNAQKASHNT